MSLHEGFRDQLADVIQNQFQEASIKDGWTDSRKLHSEKIPFLYTELGYTEMLPTYQSLNLDQLIQRSLDLSPNRSISLIDCGCGKSGAFLRSCEEHWRGRGLIYGVGITARKILTSDEDLSLASRNISIIEGNIHHIDQIVGENVGDIIVSNFSFPYLADPWGAILGINRSLRIGGVALVNYIPFGDAVNDGSNKINDFLSKLEAISGLEARINNKFLPDSFSLSWEKTLDILPISLSYEGHTRLTTLMLSREPFHVDRVLYTMDI